MQHKARLTWLPALAISALLLSSCGPGATTQPPTATTAPQPTGAVEPVTIVLWQHHTDPFQTITNDLIQEFQAANPGIKIKFESLPYGAYWEKLAPSLEAGSGPDVFKLPANQLFEFYQRGQLTAVPQSVMSTEDIEGAFVDWTIALLKQDSVYYGLPTDVQPFLLFYNDDLFKEAGLDPTKDFETWEDFREAAKKLTKFDGDIMMQAGVDITGSPYQWYWSMPVQLFDAGVVDDQTLKVTYNSAPGYEMWTFLTGLVVKDKVDSPEFLAEQGKFLLGKAAMRMGEYVFSGEINAAAPDLKYSVHFPPHPAGKPLIIAGTNWAYVVSAQSKHPEAAWKWAQFLTSPDAEKKWLAGGGGVPAHKSLLEDASLRTNPVVIVGLDAMKYAKPFDSYGWDDVWYIHQAVWDDVVLNGLDVKASVDKAAAAEEKLYADKKLTP